MPKGRSGGARLRRLKFAFDLLDRKAEGRVVADTALDQVMRVDDGGMVAAEVLANGGKGTLGHFAAEIHRDLATERDMLRPLLRFEVDQADMEEIRHCLLDHLDIRFAF